jgi:hypothetical protein
MRCGIVVVAVAFVVGTAGCGGDDGPDRSALLDAQDLPSGYRLAEKQGSPQPELFLCTEPSEKPSGEAHRAFMRSPTGPFIISRVMSFSEGDAARYQQDLVDGSRCESFRDRNGCEVSIRRAEASGAGTQVVIETATVCPAIPALNAALVSVRRDDQVAQVDYEAGPEPLQAEVLDRLADRARQRLG